MKFKNYREFNSFYEMKEWLKQGEFVLPAVYKTLNDGKYYFDDAVDISGIEDMISYMFDNGYGGFQGITFNNNREVSRVLCQYMDSHFMNASETFIKINKDIVVQEQDVEKSDLSNDITLGLYNEDNGPATAFELDIEVDTHNGAVVNEHYSFTLSYGESQEQGPLRVYCEWYDYSIEWYVTTIDGGSWTGRINAREYQKEEHFSNIGTFNMGFSYDMKMFENFKHYGSVVKKESSAIEHQRFHNIILPHQFADSSITDIVIPEGIEYIGAHAFSKCRYLHSVQLPSTLKRIGRAAFRDCFRLTSIYIPENCEVIESSAFMSCSNLESVTMSKGVKNIGNRAFYNTAISTIFLPSTVENVGTKAFSHCRNLKTVYIGENVHSNSLNNDFGGNKNFNKLNGMAFYKSPIEKFIVDKKNNNVKVGKNGELMIKRRRGDKENWMIIKVPFNFSGTYVADERATSMIRNLFENSSDGDRSSSQHNIGDKLTGINFNNVSIIPRNVIRNLKNLKTIIMPHVHYINYNAFDQNLKISDVIIGSENSDDEFLQNRVITVNCKNKSGEERGKLYLWPGCRVTILTGNESLYREHPLWGKYFDTSL